MGVDEGAWHIVALAYSGQMLWEFAQAGQSPPVEPREIDVVRMAHGDGHLMSRLPAAKPVCFDFPDGGDAGC